MHAKKINEYKNRNVPGLIDEMYLLPPWLLKSEQIYETIIMISF